MGKGDRQCNFNRTSASSLLGVGDDHGEECHARGGFGEVVTFSSSSRRIDIPGRQGLYVQFDDYALPNGLQ
jgi:hypothetical protein